MGFINVTIIIRKMKKTVFFTLLIFIVAGCSDAYYVEGRITTFEATEITDQSVLLSGEIKIVYAGSESEASITDRGFVFGTNSNELNDYVSDQINGEGKFSCNISGLKPDTKYYVRAYANVGYEDNDSDRFGCNTRFYGNIIEFTTSAVTIVVPE
jgi:hypothetical protein